MTMIPSDLTSRVGQEVTVGQILGAGWRAHRTCLWHALGIMVVLALAEVVLSAALMIPAVVLFASEAPAAAAVLAGIGLLVLLAMHCLLWAPLWAGYQWSIVCSFDGRKMRLEDVFYGLRTRLSCLASLTFLELLAVSLPWLLCLGVIAVTLGPEIMRMIQARTAPGPAFLGGLLVSVLGILVAWLLGIMMQLLFFLAPLIAFTEPNPTVSFCLSSNWSALKRRFWAFLLIALTPALVGIVVSMVVAPLRMGADLLVSVSPWVGIPLVLLVLGLQLALNGWATVLTLSWKAAFFRAVCGFTLETPHPTPLGIGGVPGSAPSAPPVAQPVDAWPGDSTPPIELPPEVEGPLPFDEPNPYRPDAPDDRPPQGGAP